MNLLRGFCKGVDFVNEHVGRLASYLCAFMMVIVTFEVVARYAFNRPTIWAMEINQFLLCGLTALTGGYTLLYRGHVNVEILYMRFGTRTRALVDILTSFFFFSFVIVLLWKSGLMAAEAWRLWEKSETLFSPPLFPVKVVIPIGAFLILLQGFVQLIRNFITLITGVEEERKVKGLFEVERER